MPVSICSQYDGFIGFKVYFKVMILIKSTKIEATIVEQQLPKWVFLLDLLCRSFRFQAHFYGCVKVKYNGKIAMFRLIGKLSDMVMKNHQNLCWIVSLKSLSHCFEMIWKQCFQNIDFVITAIFISQLLKNFIRGLD